MPLTLGWVWQGRFLSRISGKEESPPPLRAGGNLPGGGVRGSWREPRPTLPVAAEQLSADRRVWSPMPTGRLRVGWWHALWLSALHAVRGSLRCWIDPRSAVPTLRSGLVPLRATPSERPRTSWKPRAGSKPSAPLSRSRPPEG